jgi:hypothetical protein
MMTSTALEMVDQQQQPHFNSQKKIYEVFDNREGCAVLFIDPSKAFDLVNFEILLSKLHDIGNRGIANIGSDLISLVGSNVSILHQMPIQEFPLLRKSTKLFHKAPSLYVNDFACNFPECHVTGYADDTNLLIRYKSIDNLNTTAKNILDK